MENYLSGCAVREIGRDSILGLRWGEEVLNSLTRDEESLVSNRAWGRSEIPVTTILWRLKRVFAINKIDACT